MSPHMHSPGQHAHHGVHPSHTSPPQYPPARVVSPPARTGRYSSLDDALGHASPHRGPGYDSGGSESSRGGHAASESRHLYPNQPHDVNSPQDYSYQTSYDSYSQYPPPRRSSASRPQSPPAQYPSQPPSSYGTHPSAYPSPYGAPPNANTSWPSSGSGSDPPSYGTPEASYSSNRPPTGPPSSLTSSRSRQKDREGTPGTRGPRPPAFSPPLDFNQLMQVYGDIMHTAAQDTASQEQAERMLWPAVEGLRQFDTAEAEKISKEKKLKIPGPREPSDTSPGPGAGLASGKRHQKEERREGQSCKVCGATQTPEWRRGPLGPRTLCNACGLVYAKILKKRNRDLAGGGRGGQSGGRGGSRRPQEESGIGSNSDGSDDESFGSQASDGYDR
ncbi:hypothetical protein SISNIDRAFT_453352 [Sistotremastrum niveocremeum HHB9708]|uniref:GATA-type domain-containing protein n=2 Tax=Sistotremastraceae TaxID=3402574 RepID=A0A164VT26_9AGAM|nr:hypothetical protein SISNIDRAFT_453352 [Sistotremastrum niveocremeum HHB9708]KZT43105.1 hypothetical protein SISSUDRAFT_1040532 [Sistotremastrum suecicum HHB10207 ss-3]